MLLVLLQWSLLSHTARIVAEKCEAQVNRTYDGDLLRTKYTATYEGCCTWCSQTQDCIGWTFLEGFGCRIFSRIRSTQLREFSISGSRQNSSCSGITDVIITGNVVSTISNMSSKDCCSYCHNYDLCASWASFTDENGTRICELTTSLPWLRWQNGTISGIKGKRYIELIRSLEKEYPATPTIKLEKLPSCLAKYALFGIFSFAVMAGFIYCRWRSRKRSQTISWVWLILAKTPYQGVASYLATQSGCLKQTWLIINLICVIAVIYQTCEDVNHYLEYPIATSFEITRGGNLLMPNAILCPHSRFNPDKLEHLNVSYNHRVLLQLGFLVGLSKNLYSKRAADTRIASLLGSNEGFISYDSLGVQQMFNIVKQLVAVDKFASRNGGIANLYHLLFNKCQDFIAGCAIGDVEYNCCESAGEYLSGLGMCAVIPLKATDISVEGKDAFTVHINMRNSLFEVNTGQIPLNAGLELMLQDGQTGSVKSDITLIPLGFETTIDLKQVSHELINRPEAQCTNRKGYQHNECLMRCMDEAGEKCNCTIIELSSAWPNGTKFCSAVDMFRCYMPIIIDLMWNWEHVTVKCRSQCIYPCRRTEYEKLFTFTKLSERRAQPYLNKTEIDNWINGTAIVNFRFSNHMQMTITQYFTINTADFVAELGGAVEFCLGGSLLSIIYVTFNVALHGLKRFCSRHRAGKSQDMKHLCLPKKFKH